MLRIQTANLGSAQRQRVHADFLVNEQTYFQLRDQLLACYEGQWVAVANGKVISAGNDLMKVTESAAAAGGHPFIARVGAEDQVTFRMRRVEFAYDANYQPFPLPLITVTFWNHTETHSQTYLNVIPDTGADVCALPDSDCSSFDLFSSPYLSAVSGGVAGAVTAFGRQPLFNPFKGATSVWWAVMC